MYFKVIKNCLATKAAMGNSGENRKALKMRYLHSEGFLYGIT